MSNEFATPFNPQGAGASYAFQVAESEEDAMFRKGATRSKYKQYWNTVTPSHAVMILQNFTNNGAGNNMEAQLTKSPAYYHTTYITSTWKGLQPNLKAGETQSSWVNGRGFHAITDATIRVANQLIHATNGLIAFMNIDLDGQLSTYGRFAGVHLTRQQLVEESSKSSMLYTLAKGWSFADPEFPGRAWSVGGVAFHSVSCKISTRDISELYVNYNSANSNAGVYSLPFEVGTGKAISASSVNFQLATKAVFVGKAEENGLLSKTVANQSLFRECIMNQSKTIVASSSELRHDIDIDARGSVAYIAVTIRSAKDLAANNWLKDVADSGELYVKNCMIITGGTAYEDGLPANFYTGPKHAESFGTDHIRHTLIFSFEDKANSPSPTGQLTTTNMEKLKFSAVFPPHTEDLKVDIMTVLYNGWYTIGGSCSRLWA